MRANLTGLKFRLDLRTGAIIAEEEPGAGDERATLLGGEDIYRSTGFGDGSTPLSASLFNMEVRTVALSRKPSS